MISGKRSNLPSAERIEHQVPPLDVPKRPQLIQERSDKRAGRVARPERFGGVPKWLIRDVRSRGTFPALLRPGAEHGNWRAWSPGCAGADERVTGQSLNHPGDNWKSSHTTLRQEGFARFGDHPELPTNDRTTTAIEGEALRPVGRTATFKQGRRRRQWPGTRKTADASVGFPVDSDGRPGRQCAPCRP